MIKGYLQYRRVVFCFYLVVSAVVLLVCFAYTAEMELALYILGVLTYLLLLFVAVDAVRFYRKIRCLQEIYCNLSQYAPELPQYANQIEQLYGGMIERLYQMIEKNT